MTRGPGLTGGPVVTLGTCGAFATGDSWGSGKTRKTTGPDETSRTHFSGLSDLAWLTWFTGHALVPRQANDSGHTRHASVSLFTGYAYESSETVLAL